MQRNIDFGSFPDDPDADAIRTAFQKVQENFTELYSGVGSGVTSIVAGQGIQLGGTGSGTGTVIIEADIACIQVQSSTLALGVLGSTSDESYVLIPSSSQVLTIDLPANIVAENLELTGNLTVGGDFNFGNSITANFFIGDGGLLTNISAGSGSYIENGNSNVVVDANSNVRTSVAGNVNVFVVTGSGANVSGYATVTGNITAGNADLGNLVIANYFVGDGGLLSNIAAIGSGNSISSGNSNVVVDANSNVRTSVGGVANVFVVTSTSATVTGDMTVTGNANIGGGSGGNIFGANNITSNILIALQSATLGNSVTANYFIGDGGLLTNIAVSAGTSIVNGNSNVVVDANGNVRTSVAGNANIVVVTGTGANIAGYLNLTGNANAGNIGATNGIFTNVTGNGATLTSITGGNVTGQVGNALVAGTVYTAAQPNITSVGNLTSLGVIGNITAGNANLGNVASANYFIGDGGLLSNIVAVAGSAITNGTSNVVVDANANVRTSVSGNSNVFVVTGSGANLTGSMTVTGSAVIGSGSGGNVTGANVISANTLLAFLSANLGNSVSANYFLGDGGLLTNISVTAGSSIVNGTSNVVVDANGNVRTSVAGNANIVVVTSTGANIAGYANITGNANAGNIGATNGVFTNVSGNGAGITYITGANVVGEVPTANLANLVDITQVNDNFSYHIVLSEGHGNKDLHIDGDDNLQYNPASGILTAVRVDADNFVGNGSLLTDVSAGTIVSPGNVTTNLIPSSNITYDLGNNTNRFKDLYLSGNSIYLGNVTLTSSNSNLSVSGNISASNGNLGNALRANYFIGDGSLLTNVAGQTANSLVNGNSNVVVDANSNVRISVSGTANVIQVSNAGASVAGNVEVSENANIGGGTGGSISGANLVSANYFQGNGSLLSGISAGNIVGIVANAAYSTTAGTATTAATVTTAAQPNITSIGTLTSLTVSGNVTAGNANLGNLAIANFFSGNASLLTGIPAGNSLISGNSNIIVNTNANITMATNGAERLRIITDGNVGIGTTTPLHTLHVVGSFAATTKSFLIDHPTKPGMKLRYGSLEGPENGVYVRGRVVGKDVIDLPDYWAELVDESSLTVNLTPIGEYQKVWVNKIEDNKIHLKSDGSIDCFFVVFAERKDVEKLKAEF